MAEDKQQRPEIEITLSPPYKAIEIVTAATVLGMTVWLVVIWQDLPAEVPIHFSFGGTPDAWGSKETLGWMPAVTIFMYLLLSYFGARPRMANYPWPITEENAEDQYRLTREMIVWLKLETVCVMALILWSMVSVARGNSEILPPAYMMGLVGAIVVTIGIFFYRMYRAR